MKKYIPLLLIILVTGCSEQYITYVNSSNNITPTPLGSTPSPTAIFQLPTPFTGHTCPPTVGYYCDENGTHYTPQPRNVDFIIQVSDEYNNYVTDVKRIGKNITPTGKFSDQPITYQANAITNVIAPEDIGKEHKVEITVSKDDWKRSKLITMSSSLLSETVDFYKFSGKIAYTSIDKQSNISEINVMSSDVSGNAKVSEDGISHTKLSEDKINSIKPVWSPDGHKIAYIAQVNGENNLFTINSNGTERTKVYNNIKDSWISWSSDSKKLVFESDSFDHKKSQIFITNSDGTNQISLTNLSEQNHLPILSPDGDNIAYTVEKDGKSSINLMNTNGSNIVTISSKTGYGNFQLHQWSPDSKKIMYLDSNRKIIVINSDGKGNEIVLSETSSGLPRWSPDSSKIVFEITSSNLNNNDEKRISDIYTVNSDGTNKYQLINNKSLNTFPSFSADSKLISLVSNINGSNNIYITNSDGDTLKPAIYETNGIDYISFWPMK